VLRGLALWVRGEWSVESAAVVAPGFVDVVIVRGFEGCDEEVVVCDVCDCWVECEEGEALLWIALWALKAARKLERKGRWVGILASLFSMYRVFKSLTLQTSLRCRE